MNTTTYNIAPVELHNDVFDGQVGVKITKTTTHYRATATVELEPNGSTSIALTTDFTLDEVLTILKIQQEEATLSNLNR